MDKEECVSIGKLKYPVLLLQIAKRRDNTWAISALSLHSEIMRLTRTALAFAVIFPIPLSFLFLFFLICLCLCQRGQVDLSFV